MMRDRINLRKAAVILAGFMSLSVSLALLLSYASDEKIFHSIVFGTTSWLSYSLIHYFDVGEIVDPPAEDREGREDFEINWKMVLSAGIIFVAGISTASYGINRGELLITLAGTSTNMAGYLFGHYQLEDVLV